MPEATPEPFDLNQAGNYVRLEVAGSTVASVQVTMLNNDPTPDAFVVTVQRSLDGETWSALETPLTIAFGAFASSLSAMTPAFDCSGFKWVRIVVTTPEGAALLGRIRIYAQRVGG